MPASAIQFHDAAAAEYDAAFDWYLQRSPDSAVRFSDEVDRALVLIAQAPDRWASAPFQTRRVLLKHFPFLLIYRQHSSGVIQIVAVAHTSRKPGYWKSRV